MPAGLSSHARKSTSASSRVAMRLAFSIRTSISPTEPGWALSESRLRRRAVICCPRWSWMSLAMRRRSSSWTVTSRRRRFLTCSSPERRSTTSASSDAFAVASSLVRSATRSSRLSCMRRSPSSYRLRSVRSRAILTNPVTAPESSWMAETLPSAKNLEPSFRLSHRSSLAALPSRARRSSMAGVPTTRSSGVKRISSGCPMTSSAL